MIKFLLKLRFFDIVWIMFLAFYMLPVVPEYIPIEVRVMLWILVMVGLLLKMKLYAIPKVLPLYSIAILYIVYAICLDTGNVLELMYSYLQLMTITSVFFYINKKRDTQLARTTIVFIFLFITITSITTIVGNTIYPGASRILASSKIDAQLYHIILKMNVGGFDFTYMLVLMIPYIIYSIKNRIFPFILQLFFLLILIFAIISTEYTTAIVLMLVSSFTFFLPKSIGKNNVFPISLIVILIYMLFHSALPSILDNMSANIESEVVSVRIQDIISSLRGEDLNYNSDLGHRMDLMKKSTDAFLSNILFGSYYSVGGHSYIMDSLGRFGCWGILGLVIMIVTYSKLYLIPSRNEPYYGHLLLYFIMYIGLLILNPQPFYVATTLIIPLLFKYSSCIRYKYK